MTEVRQLPDNPTNADLALSITDLHGCLETHIKFTNKSLKLARKERRAISKRVDGIYNGIDNIKVTVWKGVGVVGTAILAGLVGIGFHTFELSRSTQTEIAAKTNDRYTAADAARDKVAQDLINQQIIAKLNGK